MVEEGVVAEGDEGEEGDEVGDDGPRIIGGGGLEAADKGELVVKSGEGERIGGRGFGVAHVVGERVRSRSWLMLSRVRYPSR